MHIQPSSLGPRAQIFHQYGLSLMTYLYCFLLTPWAGAMSNRGPISLLFMPALTLFAGFHIPYLLYGFKFNGPWFACSTSPTFKCICWRPLSVSFSGRPLTAFNLMYFIAYQTARSHHLFLSGPFLLRRRFPWCGFPSVSFVASGLGTLEFSIPSFTRLRRSSLCLNGLVLKVSSAYSR